MRRTIECLSLKDEQASWSFDDHGVDRDGVPTSRRQMLQRVLSKKDAATGLPIFRIVKVGTWKMGPNEEMPKHEEFYSFDDLWLTNREPTDAWLRQRDIYIGKKREQAADAARDLQRRMGASIGEAMTSLAANIAMNSALPGAAPSATPAKAGKGNA